MRARVQLPASLRVQRLRLLQSNQVNGDLAFKIGGYIRDLAQVKVGGDAPRNVQEGDFVSKGTVLAVVRESDSSSASAPRPPPTARRSRRLTLLLVPVIYAVFVLDLKFVRWDERAPVVVNDTAAEPAADATGQP